MAKSNAISFRFSKETISLLKQLADNDQRSITNTLEYLIHSEAKKQKIRYFDENSEIPKEIKK